VQGIEALIAKARSLDTDVTERHEAFGELVKRFQDMAYGYAYAILRDFDLAQDAAQETFISAYRNLGRLRDPKAFPSWLRRIVMTQCNRLRRGKHLFAQSIEAAPDIVSDRPDPAAAAEDRELKDKVLDAIKGLPKHERMVTTLFYINGYSQSEIAGFLDVPLTTVKKRLQYSRERLKERMLDMVRDNLQEKRPSKDDRFSTMVRLFSALEAAEEEGHLTQGIP
jgi:RNA polymerase sigma factor (sigma-70 family)